MVRRITKEHARRFLVRRHLLDPPRALPGEPGSVLRVVEQLGSLQFDPLEVTGARNHDMVLHARIAGYERRHCEQWLYPREGPRRLFEGYNKSLNILPAHELPFHRVAWERAAARLGARILDGHAKTASAILARIDAEGPLATSAFREHGASVDWYWAPTRVGRAVLEALFETGVLGIHRRDGNRRTFDRVERLFASDLLASRVPADEALGHRLLSRFRGVGLMGATASSELTTGTAKVAERTRAIAALVARGALVPCEIEGARGMRYVLRDELPVLDETARARRRPSREVIFVAPLDPLMWDRRLVRDVFGFDYVWEVYVPPEKRVHGYYVMPLLFGDRLVGRIEPRLDRATRTLDVLGLSFEPTFAPLEAPGFAEALARAAEAFRAFVGADRVRWPRTRVARALAAASRGAA